MTPSLHFSPISLTASPRTPEGACVQAGKHCRAATLALALALAVGTVRAADPPAAPKRPEYGAFRLITDRNIFNAGRSGVRPSRGSREPQRQIKVDSFALRGIISYDKGRFAFFDGTSAQYRKAVRANESIGGWKVLDVSTTAVQVEAGGKQHQLTIGSQLRREDEGEWHLLAQSEPAASSWGGESAGSDGSTAGGGADDILKRLMQQREKEMQ
jgi:hypothetical protein